MSISIHIHDGPALARLRADSDAVPAASDAHGAPDAARVGGDTDAASAVHGSEDAPALARADGSEKAVDGASEGRGDASLARTAAGDDRGNERPGAKTEVPDSGEASPAPESGPRAREKSIFLLLALALLAASLAQAALPPPATPLEEAESWEVHAQRVGHRSYHPFLIGPPGVHPLIWCPQTVTLGHRAVCTVAAGPRVTPARSLCSVAIELDATPPALRFRGRVAAVPVAEIRITLPGLARSVAGLLRRWLG